MSSINLIPNESQVSFTEDEKTAIIEISNEYSSLYKEIVRIQEEIQNASDRVLELTTQMTTTSKREEELMLKIAAKHDLDPKTVSNEAANLILNSKTK